jgi:hypothetical protein
MVKLLIMQILTKDCLVTAGFSELTRSQRYKSLAQMFLPRGVTARSMAHWRSGFRTNCAFVGSLFASKCRL